MIMRALCSFIVRVLLVHNRYRIPGGEERHIDLLEDSLLCAGFDVARFEVASPDDASRVERLRLGFGLTYRPAGARCLREVLAREKPDIVHFHNLFPLLTSAAAREAHLYGAGVVLTVHNFRFACPAGTLLRNGRIHEDCIDGSSLLCGLRNCRGAWGESIAYGMAIELQRRLRLLHRWVDAYVAPSNFVAMMLARAGYPSDRIHTIYHGTPIDQAPSAAGEFALYAGRLSSEKGIETLLEAAARVSGVPIVIAGDGPLADLVDLARGGRVIRLGRVHQNVLAKLRREAFATIVPSRCYETLSFGALESMASGTPVIASRLGALAEIIEDEVTGILVPPEDPFALAEATRALWSDRSRAAALGGRAWRYAREHLCPTTQTAKLVGLYESLVSGTK